MESAYFTRRPGIVLFFYQYDNHYMQGRIQGGGGPGGQDPPFWGTPKLHKEGKNGALVRAKTPHFST